MHKIFFRKTKRFFGILLLCLFIIQLLLPLPFTVLAEDETIPEESVEKALPSEETGEEIPEEHVPSSGNIQQFPLKVQGHPRLYFTADELKELQKKSADETVSASGLSGKKLWDTLEQAAKGFLTEKSVSITYYNSYQLSFPMPPKQLGPMSVPPGYTGGSAYPYWIAYVKAIQERIETLSLSYCITGKQEYAEKAKQYALEVARWNTWVDAQNLQANTVCYLETTHLTLAVSGAYDMLYDLFTPQERKELENAILTKGLTLLYQDTEQKVDHNIYMMKNCSMGFGAAVLLGTEPTADKYLSRAMEYYKWYLDMRLSSGQQEGLMYTSYSMENLMKSVDATARVTGMRDLVEHPYIDDYVVNWVIYSLIPGGSGLVNFSDGSVSNYFFNTLSIAANWLENGYAGWYIANTTSTASNFEKFLYYNPNMKITPPDDLPNSLVLEDIGWADLRTGWSSNDTLLSMVSNNSKLGHNHYDQNSFILGTGKTTLAADPGYQDYSAGPVRSFTISSGHNTIYVDGRAQSIRGNGSIKEEFLSPSYDYVIGSAPGAYAPDLGLKRFDRHIVRTGSGHYVMMDDLKTDKDRSFQWQIFSGIPAQFEIDGQTAPTGTKKEGSHLYIEKGTAQLAAKFLSPEPLEMNVYLQPGVERYGPLARVGSTTPATSYRFLTVMKTSQMSGSTKILDLGDPVETSGQGYKSMDINGSAVFFYRSIKSDDYITFEFNVEGTGDYDASMIFVKAPSYAQVQVSIDGKDVGEVYDGYDPEVIIAPDHSLGRLHLEKGKHRIKFQVLGKQEESTNYYICMDSLALLPVKDEAAQQQQRKVKVDASLIQENGVYGTSINVEQGKEYVLFQTGTEPYEAQGIQSDSFQTVVGVDKNNMPSSYAMTDGTTLKYQGKTLLQSDGLRFCGSLYPEKKEGFTASFQLVEESKITFYTGGPVIVYLNGKRQNNAFYDTETGTVRMKLPAGVTELYIKKEPAEQPGGGMNPPSSSPEEKPEMPSVTPPPGSGQIIIPTTPVFQDINGHWAQNDIVSMTTKGIIKGISNTKFAPDAEITRAEFAALLQRALGIVGKNPQIPFHDVTPKDWYAVCVQAVYEHGFMNGSDGMFRPDDAITREEMAKVILAVYKNKIGKPDESPAYLEKFQDKNQISNWAVSGVAGCVQAGILKGRSENRFEPHGTLTRAECAALWARLLERMQNS